MLTSCVRSLVLQLSGNLIQQDGALKIAQELPDVERLNEAQTLGPAELARRRGSQLTGLSAPVRDSSKNMSKALRDDFSDEEESGFRDEMEEDEGDEDEDEDEDESTTSGGKRRGKSRGSSSSSRSSTANRPSMLESVVEDDNEEPEPFSDDDESVVSNGSKVGD